MSIGTRLDVRNGGRNLLEALVYPLTSNRRLAGAGLATGVTYLLVVLSTFPQFTIQLLARDLTDVGYALSVLTREIYRSTGWVGIGLLITYTLLTGVAIVNAAALLRRARRAGGTTLAGIVPGLLAAGCASCGAGLLGALGFVGAMATLPYDGNLLRLGGVLLILFFLARAGDPRTCSIGPGTAG